MAQLDLRRDLGRCLPYLRPYTRRIGVVMAITVISSGLPALEPLGREPSSIGSAPPRSASRGR